MPRRAKGERVRLCLHCASLNLWSGFFLTAHGHGVRVRGVVHCHVHRSRMNQIPHIRIRMCMQIKNAACAVYIYTCMECGCCCMHGCCCMRRGQHAVPRGCCTLSFPLYASSVGP